MTLQARGRANVAVGIAIAAASVVVAVIWQRHCVMFGGLGGLVGAPRLPFIGLVCSGPSLAVRLVVAATGVMIGAVVVLIG